MGKPLNLTRIHQYTGYQLYSTVEYKGKGSDVCFRYVIAVILAWLRDRMGQSNVPKKLYFPEPEEAAIKEDLELVQYHEVNGFMIHISSLRKEGYWAISVHEPDSERNNRPALIGRTIITEIGLHILDDKKVELGIKTTIQDPIGQPELPSSFRPAIVRTLLLAEPIELSHIAPIRYREVRMLRKKQDIEDFDRLMNDSDECLPAVIFSYEQQSIQDMIKESGSDLKTQNMYGAFAALIDQKELSGVIDKNLPSLSYDVDEFAHLTYGYGYTYLVDKNAFGLVADRFGEKLVPGDVIFVDPLRFNDGCATVYRIKDEKERRKKNASCYKELEEKVLYYSKRKDVDYHGVCFERTVRDLVRNSKITDEIRKNMDEEFVNDINKLIDDNDQLKAAKENLEINNMILVEENQLLKEKRKVDGTGIWISIPEAIVEAYEDEIKDLIVDSLKIAYRNCREDRTRRKILIENLLSVNKYSGKGKMRFDKAKSVLLGDPDLKNESSRSAMKKLGFEVEKMKGGHNKVYLSVDGTCFVTVSATTSNHHGSCSANNAAAWLVKQFSVCSGD